MRDLHAGLLVLWIACTATAGELSPVVERLRSPDPEVRAGARAELVAEGARALSAVREGLASDDPLLTATCADLVAELGLRAARRDVVEALGRAEMPRLALRSLCTALGQIGDSRDYERLAALADSVPEAALALAALGARGGARERLQELAAKAGASPQVLFAAAVLGNDGAVDGLIRALERPEEKLAALALLREYAGVDAGADRPAWETWWRREQLARSLGNEDWDESEAALARVRGAKEKGGSEFRVLCEDLLAVAQNPSAPRFARTKSVLALGLVGGRDLAAPVLDLLETDADPQVRLYAAEALGRIGVPETAVDLVEYLIFDEEPFRKLASGDENTRYYTIDSEVCKSLVSMGVKGGLEYMIRQLHQRLRIRVYHEALRELRRTTGQEFGYRQDAPFTQRLAAAERWKAWFDDHRQDLVLPGRPSPRAAAFVARVQKLVDRLGNFKFLYMWRSREALVLLGETATPEVVKGLKRPEKHIRVHCAEILGRIHARRERGTLAVLLSDAEPEVRTAAAAALAEMGPGDATAYVIQALADPAPDVRIEAARALAKADFDSAVPALRRALEGDEEKTAAFRREALFALGAHGYADDVDRLASMLEHPDVAFRQVVADRLYALTGRNPGVEEASISEWKAWWSVSRKGYKGIGDVGESR